MLAIEIKDLTKTLRVGFWGRQARLLDGITLNVEAGTAHGLVGANGAGKSTTMRILAGAASPSSGTVKLNGRDSREAGARADFGYAPDTPGVSVLLTGRQNIRLHADVIGASHADADEALAEVELAARGDELVRTYSKGMTQRVALAMALVGKPKVLVLDEPMSGLDPPGRELVRGIIRRRVAAGCTVLFSSHVVADVADLCTTMTVIDRGQTVFEGRIDALLGDARAFRIVLDGTPAWPADLGTATVANGRTIVEVADDDVLTRAIACARSSGVALHSVESLRPKLEERLVALMHSADSTMKRGRA